MADDLQNYKCQLQQVSHQNCDSFVNDCIKAISYMVL